MPYKIVKVKGGYRVRGLKTIKAKRTTLAKAKRQKRLLYAVEHGWRPTGKKAQW